MRSNAVIAVYATECTADLVNPYAERFAERVNAGDRQSLVDFHLASWGCALAHGAPATMMTRVPSFGVLRAVHWERKARVLDHVTILGDTHLEAVLTEYVACFNSSRPHQGIEQRVPVPFAEPSSNDGGKVVALPVLGSLHHEYRRAA